jgi:hypothetical protein
MNGEGLYLAQRIQLQFIRAVLFAAGASVRFASSLSSFDANGGGTG